MSDHADAHLEIWHPQAVVSPISEALRGHELCARTRRQIDAETRENSI